MLCTEITVEVRENFLSLLHPQKTGALLRVLERADETLALKNPRKELTESLLPLFSSLEQLVPLPLNIFTCRFSICLELLKYTKHISPRTQSDGVIGSC